MRSAKARSVAWPQSRKRIASGAVQMGRSAAAGLGMTVGRAGLQGSRRWRTASPRALESVARRRWTVTWPRPAASWVWVKAEAAALPADHRPHGAGACQPAPPTSPTARAHPAGLSCTSTAAWSARPTCRSPPRSPSTPAAWPAAPTPVLRTPVNDGSLGGGAGASARPESVTAQPPGRGRPAPADRAAVPQSIALPAAELGNGPSGRGPGRGLAGAGHDGHLRPRPGTALVRRPCGRRRRGHRRQGRESRYTPTTSSCTPVGLSEARGSGSGCAVALRGDGMYAACRWLDSMRARLLLRGGVASRPGRRPGVRLRSWGSPSRTRQRRYRRYARTDRAPVVTTVQQGSGSSRVRPSTAPCGRLPLRPGFSSGAAHSCRWGGAPIVGARIAGGWPTSSGAGGGG
ncbi:hypothetical protein P3T27_005062 [Kitasatospora sp. MAA19]|nr:hypothetical protein [Kitasatospora sp. MAA19]